MQRFDTADLPIDIKHMFRQGRKMQAKHMFICTNPNLTIWDGFGKPPKPMWHFTANQCLFVGPDECLDKAREAIETVGLEIAFEYDFTIRSSERGSPQERIKKCFEPYTDKFDMYWHESADKHPFETNDVVFGARATEKLSDEIAEDIKDALSQEFYSNVHYNGYNFYIRMSER